MFNKFTFLDNSDQKVFFTSDTHFCHNKDFVYGVRGFKTVEEHNETLITNWNSVVSKNDHIIHLGDFLVGAGQNSFADGQDILFKLNGHIHFVWGNHNAYVKDIYKIALANLIGETDFLTEIYPITYENKITFYGNNLLAKVKTVNSSQLIFCAHFAHRIWIDSHKGDVWHLSGHSHGNDKESNPDDLTIKRLDVGIDNFPYPVSFIELKQIMSRKGLTKIDHHK